MFFWILVEVGKFYDYVWGSGWIVWYCCVCVEEVWWLCCCNVGDWELYWVVWYYVWWIFFVWVDWWCGVYLWVYYGD